MSPMVEPPTLETIVCIAVSADYYSGAIPRAGTDTTSTNLVEAGGVVAIKKFQHGHYKNALLPTCPLWSRL